MYHSETVIDGILHYRDTPQAKWKPYTIQEITKKHEKLRKEELRIALATL